MSNVSGFKNKTVIKNIVYLAMMLASVSAVAAKTGAKKVSKVQIVGKLSEEQRSRRLDHAKELLGRGYSKSVVRTGENLLKINSSIYKWTQEALPKKHRNNSKQIAQAIIDEAYRYELDPVFVMAVIQTESSFNPEMVGGVGEIGLMQIRPETAKWIVEKTDLKIKRIKLRDPLVNIKIGVAYIAYLRERFDDHARLYVSAYNMGPSNVKQLLRKDVWPKEYPAKVMNRYVDYYSQLLDVQPPVRRTVSAR